HRFRDPGDARAGRRPRGDRPRELLDPACRGLPGGWSAVQERLARDPRGGRAPHARLWRGVGRRYVLHLHARRDHRGRDLPAGRAPRPAGGHRRIRKLVRSFRWPPPPDGKSKRWPAPRGRDEPGRPLLSLTPTELRAMPHGATLEYLLVGESEPTTAF